MKYLLPLMVLSLFLVSCKTDVTEKQDQNIILSGNITNYTDQAVWLIAKENTKLKVDSNGTFIDTLAGVNSYLTFYVGRDEIKFYAKKGENVSITVDANDFANTIAIDGVNQSIITYLKDDKLRRDSLELSNRELYKLEEEEFTTKVEDYLAASQAHLDSYEGLDVEFVTTENDNLKYESLLRFNNYESYHKYYAEKEDFKSSEAISSKTAGIDFDNESLYNTVPNYQKLADGHHSNGLYEDDDLSKAKALLKIKSPSIRNSASKSLQYTMSPSNERLDSIYAIITELSSDKDFLKKVSEKYEKLKNLKEGMPSPTFSSYENHKGGTTSSTDLNGKYTYIDVWATWCGPCLAEIPSLKKVEKQYHDRNINFVSISIDKSGDHDKWVKMVNDKELSGIQLMADNAWDSEFVKDFAIDGIPRFILLDPQGNIVSADAPRPSDDNISTFLDREGL